MDRPRLWTTSFVVGTLVNFLLLLNYYLLMVVMADYSESHFGVSSSSAGLAASMFVIGALAARFFAAKLMERIGKGKLLVIGALLELAASAAYFVAFDISALLAIRFVHGLSYGMASTSVSTITTSIIPEERNGEGVGYFMLSITLGAAIGPFFGMVLTENGGFTLIFLACSATALLCLLGGLLLLRTAARTQVPGDPLKEYAHAAGEGARPRGIANIFEKGALPICLICAGVYFCYSSIITFLTPYAGELGLTFVASFFFIVYSIVILVTRPFTGRAFDKYGANSIMVPAFAAFCAGLVMLGLARDGALLLVSAGLLGFGVGVIQSSGLALAVSGIAPERMSYANSTFYICIDAGTGIGPFVLGFLVPVMGYSGMYIAMAALTVVLLALYLLVSRRGRRSPRGLSEANQSR